MKFDELDEKMRVFETAADHYVLPGIYMVARIDGRNFTTLTKKSHPFEAPFDIRFRDYMVQTVQHLMCCGFQVLYGYTQSDEISLLFSRNTTVFGRKTRKYNSILAGEASARFSLLLGDIGAFDCRISELPDQQDVVDYFRWRSEDAGRNALNAHCYWLQIRQGKNPHEATRFLEGMRVADKNEFLFLNGINYNDLPAWQKRGMGLYWVTVQRESTCPHTGNKIMADRRELKIDDTLPMREQYSEFIRRLLLSEEAVPPMAE